jgi:hypothetical protein
VLQDDPGVFKTGSDAAQLVGTDTHIATAMTRMSCLATAYALCTLLIFRFVPCVIVDHEGRITMREGGHDALHDGDRGIRGTCDGEYDLEAKIILTKE